MWVVRLVGRLESRSLGATNLLRWFGRAGPYARHRDRGTDSERSTTEVQKSGNTPLAPRALAIALHCRRAVLCGRSGVGAASRRAEY
jgi:hypothetical protein